MLCKHLMMRPLTGAKQSNEAEECICHTQASVCTAATSWHCVMNVAGMQMILCKRKTTGRCLVYKVVYSCCGKGSSPAQQRGPRCQLLTLPGGFDFKLCTAIKVQNAYTAVRSGYCMRRPFQNGSQCTPGSRPKSSIVYCPSSFGR